MAHLRKVPPEGVDYWEDPSTITITSDYSMSSTRLASAEDDGVIIQILKASGPNFWDPSYLYMHKFNDSGEAQRGPDGVEVMTTSRIASYMESDISKDGLGGAYSYWYDTRDMVHHAYAQHVQADGSVSWTINGVRLSTTAGQMEMYPQLVRLPSTEDILVFYRTTNFDQNLAGISGQRLDSYGQRQWGDDGVTLVDLSDQDRFNLLALQQEDGAIVLYKELPDAINSIIDAIRVDEFGVPVWEFSPLTIVSPLSEKGRVEADVNELDQVIAAWNDDRLDPNGNCIALELGDVVTEIGAYGGTTEAYGCEDCPGSRK
jgi:hypothetical protein